MPTSLRPDHETLLAHTAWVRALAQKLVRDPGRADDLVQETWLAALRRPPAERATRAWLATVLRNAFRQGERRAARRRERERAVARPERVETDVLARATTHRELVQTLTELEEPFRTTLLLRYFDDLGIDAIAARLDVPRDTVRSRLRRGLERLRARLDAEHDGDRSAWLSALAPLALGPAAPSPPLSSGPPVTGIGLGALAVNAKLKLAAACALALCGAWILTTRLAAPDPAQPAGVRAAIENERPVAPAAEALPPAPAPDARRAVHEPPPAAAEREPAVAAAPLALLRGQVIDADARPLGGFPLAVTAAGERTRVESGPGGRFELPAPETDAAVRSADERYATLLVARHVPGQSVDHVVVVAPAIALAGTVVDETGRPLADARVELVVPRAVQRDIPRVLSSSSEETFAARTDAAGAFALEAVPAVEGSNLTAEKDGYAPDERAAPFADDRALRIVLARASPEPGALAGRVVDASGAPLEGAHVAAGRATTRTDAAGEFGFEPDVSREAGELVAVYPGRLPARLDAVPSQAGSLWPDYVVLRMDREALSVEGRVVDEAGAARAGVRVWAADPTLFGLVDGVLTQVESHLAGARGWRELEEQGAHLSTTPNAFWSWTDTDDDGHFRLPGLLERTYRLKVMDPATCVHAVSEPVSAGATGVELTLPALHGVRTVAGRVRTREGYPLPGARVRLFHRAVKREHVGTTVAWDVSGPETVTDDNGRFRIEGVPAVGMRLLVSGDGLRSVTIAAEELEAADELEVEVELAADRCHFVVELADPELADRFELHGELGPVQLEFRRGGHATSTDTSHVVDGRSFVLAAPEGAYDLVLFKDDAVVERRMVRLTPGAVNVLR